MIDVKEATNTILANVPVLPAETCPLGQAHNRTLRQPILADRDLPPFDRIMMDGIALHSPMLEDLDKTEVRLPILGLQAAGSPVQTLPKPDGCIEVATGATLPQCTDTILPVEDIEHHGDQVLIPAGTPYTPGKYIHKQASDHPAGTTLLHPGTLLAPKEIAVVASSGCATVEVSALPSVALVSTGDELVPVDQNPLPHQIRQSNAHTLAAAILSRSLGTPHLHHIQDEPDELEKHIYQLLGQHDVLVLSGGVSKGKKDFLPQVLEKLGVQKLLHWVAQRPGKPLWFGKARDGTPVFGLPGNPLSTLTCFHRYLLPALEAMSGRTPAHRLLLPLAKKFGFPPPLTCFLPVALTHSAAGTQAIPAPAHNSGDYSGILRTHGFIEIPAGTTEAQPGEAFPFIPW